MTLRLPARFISQVFKQAAAPFNSNLNQEALMYSIQTSPRCFAGDGLDQLSQGKRTLF